MQILHELSGLNLQSFPPSLTSSFDLSYKERMSSLKVFFYVQHLIGIGHVRRAAALTRAFIKHGFEVDFVMGGLPVEGIALASANLISLPPVRVYRVLISCRRSGVPISQSGQVAKTARKRDFQVRIIRELGS